MWRVVILVTVLAGTASADDPFACVDPDVANAFLGNSYGSTGGYSTKIPEDFVKISMPDEFSLVGSQSLDVYSSVAFKSGLPAEQALSSAVESMQELDWIELDNLHNERTRRGFQSSSTRLHAVICNKEDSDFLFITSFERSGSSFVSVARHQTNMECSQDGLVGDQYKTGTLFAYMPTMELPDGVAALSSGTSGGGYDAESNIEVSGSISRKDLASHFEGQIRDQGWTSQTSWSSIYSSGSIWALNSDKHGLLVGTLHLIGAESGLIRARFNILMAESKYGRANTNWSLSSGGN